MESIVGRYARQAEAGIEGLRRAARVCRAVQAELVGEDTLAKRDRSPVTVADFASQAVVIASLGETATVVAEEASAALRESGAAPMAARVARFAGEALGRELTASEALDWIDRGGAAADPSGRFWTLDPIDGTKGFLRRGQYAVALGLIEAGEVVLGLLACPELRLPGAAEDGALLVAAREQGCHALPLWAGGSHAVGETRKPPVAPGSGGGSPPGEAGGEERDRRAPAETATGGTPTEGDGGCAPVERSAETSLPARRLRVDSEEAAGRARFCEPVESGHSDQERSARLAARLGIAADPLRIDSQAKYAAVAAGMASIYLRLPTRVDYQEKIWDHAAGSLVVEEAGGRVTDIDGRPLDFTRGRTLASNRGVVATNGRLHDAVLAAIAAEPA